MMKLFHFHHFEKSSYKSAAVLCGCNDLFVYPLSLLCYADHFFEESPGNLFHERNAPAHQGFVE